MVATRTLGAALLAAALTGPGMAAAQDGGAAEMGAAADARAVFFGFTVVPFGADGIETVSSVARRFRVGSYGAVEVAGHADTVGEGDVNAALSQRRAAFTRDELLARGVPDAAIALSAFGETRLAEQTGDEVRRAANRRVEIAILGAGLGAPIDETRPPAMKLPPAPAIVD